MANDIDKAEYGTPKPILHAAYQLLGGIDLDPWSSSWHNRRVGALAYYDKRIDGNKQSWLIDGRPSLVWGNPVYSKGVIGPSVGRWLQCAEESYEMLGGLIITNCTVSSPWCQALLEHPHCLLRKRQAFVHPEINGGLEPQHSNEHAQMITYAGTRWPAFRQIFGEFGVVR